MMAKEAVNRAFETTLGRGHPLRAAHVPVALCHRGSERRHGRLRGKAPGQFQEPLTARFVARWYIGTTRITPHPLSHGGAGAQGVMRPWLWHVFPPQRRSRFPAASGPTQRAAAAELLVPYVRQRCIGHFGTQPLRLGNKRTISVRGSSCERWPAKRTIAPTAPPGQMRNLRCPLSRALQHAVRRAARKAERHGPAAHRARQPIHFQGWRRGASLSLPFFRAS